MAKKVSGLIVAPMWRAFMDEVIKTVPDESFNKPLTEDSYDLKPVLRGEWLGGLSNITENLVLNDGVPYNSLAVVLFGGVHSILYWVDKDNPRGPTPSNPGSDPQFERWEYSIRNWATAQGYE